MKSEHIISVQFECFQDAIDLSVLECHQYFSCELQLSMIIHLIELLRFPLKIVKQLTVIFFRHVVVRTNFNSQNMRKLCLLTFITTQSGMVMKIPVILGWHFHHFAGGLVNVSGV